MTKNVVFFSILRFFGTPASVQYVLGCLPMFSYNRLPTGFGLHGPCQENRTAPEVVENPLFKFLFFGVGFGGFGH